MSKASQKKFETCPMLSRSDWGLSHINSKGLSHCLSLNQSPVGFHGPTVGGWLIFLNGCHRGEDMRLPIGESTIGSAGQNHCVITGVGVGSYHATLSISADNVKITPAAANRVLKINNVAVSETQKLKDGFLISFGEVHCLFRLSSKFEPGYAPSDVIIPKNMPEHILPIEMVCGWLVFSRGPSLGQDFRLINGECRIGSQLGLELSVPDHGLSKHALTLHVSRRDCKIVWAADPRKVRVNGSEMRPAQLLRDSDVLEIEHLEAYLKWHQV